MFMLKRKEQISAIIVALICSFSMTSVLAAPIAPTVRVPGKERAQPEATVVQPALQTTAPTQTATPVAAKPESTTPIQVVKATPAPAQQASDGSKQTAQAAQSKNETTPGHSFRIQNKEENYNSLLSKTATRKLDTALADMIGGYGEKVPGLAVIVFKDGKEVYRNMMGNRFLSPRNKNWNLPVTADSRFRIASISKIFTAAGYMQLVEQGKINLDEDVSRYLGFTLRNPRYPSKVITSRMLLSHTSSIRDYPSPYVPYKSSVRSFFETENCWTASKIPGTYFSYSNLNFILLATIIERVSGQRFDKYISKNVLKPLDIKGSFNLRDFSAADLQKMGTLYRKTKGEAGRYYAQIDDRPIELPNASLLAIYKPGTNAGIFSPQGGLRISPDELSHMLQMLMNEGNYQGKQILSPATVRLMEKPIWQYSWSQPNGDIENDSIESYGLALQYFSGTGSTKPAPDRPDLDLIGHLGEAYGFIGGLMWQPNTKNGFVFLQNGFATDYKYNKGRYSRNYRWEEKFMKAIIENVFAK
ncbi:MAG: serine hydrolase [Acidaminococcaceae bacterium]|nr:serine hydrolase [Acidaminococcaceae bacterium]MBR2183532.1 serine hydrolase [Acidaminococcaceae bacterium]